MIKRAAMAVAVGMILTCSGLGQDAHYDISVNGMGVLSKQTSGNQVVQTPTQGYGVVAVGEVRLNSRFAVQANAGHFDNSQKYATGTLDYRIQSTVTELSGALVCRLFQTEKWKPFLFGGAGVLFFNPDHTLVIEENPLSPGEVAGKHRSRSPVGNRSPLRRRSRSSLAPPPGGSSAVSWPDLFRPQLQCAEFIHRASRPHRRAFGRAGVQLLAGMAGSAGRYRFWGRPRLAILGLPEADRVAQFG